MSISPSRTRRIVRVLSAVAVIVCLLLVLLLFVLHSARVRRYAVNRATSLLASQQIELRTDELRYNLFNLSIDLRNIRVRAAVPSAPVFATIGRAQLNLSLSQLLRGRYVVDVGSVEDVDIHYFVDADGRDNLPRPLADPNEPRKPLDYLIANLSANGRLHYENRAQNIDVVLPLDKVAITGDALTDRHQISVESSGGQVRIQRHETPIDRVAGQIDLGDDDLTVSQLDLEALGSRANLTGSLRTFSAPEIAVQLKADVAAARAAAFVDVTSPVDGRVSIDATATGPLSAPVVDGRVSGSSLQFGSLTALELDVSSVYDPAAATVEISSARAQAPWGSASLTGQLALNEQSRSRVEATFAGVDAAALMRAFEQPQRIASRVDGTLRANWPGLEYLKAEGEGRATLTPTSARIVRGELPVVGRVVLRGNGNGVVARLDRVRAAGARVAGQVAIDSSRRVRGELAGNVADVMETATALEAFLGRPRGSLMPAAVAGAMTIDARIGGTLDGPTAAATLAAPSLAIGNATDIALDAELRYAPNALSISRAELRWLEARAALNGSVGLTGARPVELTVEASAVDLQTLLRATNQATLPVFGTLATQGTVTGTVARPLAAFAVQGTDLAAFEERFGTLAADITVAGPDVALTRLVIDKPQPAGDGQITGTGSYNLDQKSYAVALSSTNVQLVGLTLPGGQRIRGDLEIAAKGSGTIASPAGTANLTIDGLEIDGLTARASDASKVTETTRWGRLDIAATAANGQATVNASARQFNVSADANIGLERPWPATVKVRATDVDLTALPVAVEPLTGTFRGTIDATGPLAEPAQGQASATIERFEGSWNRQPFTVTSPSRLQYANERLDIEHLELAAGDSSLVVSGALPLTDRAGRGEIAIEGHANLATLAQYLPAGTDLTGDGAVTVAGTLRGTLTAIDPDLVLNVDDGLVLSRQIEPGLSNIHLRARVMNGVADVEQLTANWGSASIDASGRIPLEAVPPLPVEIPRMGGPATFKASVRDLDPAAIPGAPSGLSGRISLDADAAASRADLAALEGRITFSELQVAFDRLDLAQQGLSTIAIASGAATIERLSLAGSAGSLATTGRVGLTGERALNLDVGADLQMAAVSALTERVRAEGAARLNVAARGTLISPELNGTVSLANATLVSDEPNVAAENIAAELTLAGSRVELTRLSADVNGGTLEGSGTMSLGAGTVSDIDLQFTARDVAYDAPLDLRSLSDSTIRVTRRGDDILVTGQVTIDEAGQTADINFDEGLLAAMNARPTLDLTEERNPLLERVRFNVDVDTATPILVENNLAHAEVDVDVRVVGTPYEPGLTGRLNLLEGAEITLNERTYQAERGVITFVDERRIVPSVDLLLNTSAGSYDITIAVTGEPGETETTLTSTPSLPEPDIMAMLVTGRTLDEMRGEEYEVAREQVLSYLAGRLGSRLGRGIERATGLSEVRVEPQLIANETDPAARLTVGQELTDEFKLVYSTNLADSNDQIWLAEYDVTRRFKAETVRQSDNSYRFDFRHDVRFGGEPEPRRQPRHRPTIARLAVITDSGSEDPALQERLKVKEGDSYDFFAVRRGVERIEQTFVEQGYLQSRVRLEQKVEDDLADLTVRVERGPLVEIRFEGATPPADVQEDVRVQWHRGVFDKQRADDSADALRAWLMGDDHLQPKVDYEIMHEGDDRRAVLFRIQPGPRYVRVLLAFEGASGIDPDQLDAIIDQQKLERQLFTDPLVVTALLQRYYREQGFLSATIDEPRYEFQGDTARVVMTVSEGPRFTVRSLTASGNSVFTTDELVSGLPLVAGDLYLPSAAEGSLERIRDSYWRQGYNDLRSDYTLAVDRAAGQVDVKFTLVEGRQSVIAEIGIDGAAKTSERLVREQVELATAQPLDVSALAKSRRNLYDTGAFSTVDITREDLEGDEPAPADATAPAAQADDQKPVRLNVSVREVQPFQLRYGASFDSERGIGGILDISNHNSLGKARVLGLQSRYDRQLREGRAYISQPSLRYWPLKITGSIYIREELNPPTDRTDPFDVSRKGVSVQQEMELRDAYVWSYGYRYERATTLQPSLGAGFAETLTVSPLTATLTRETRDEVLDASRGAFLSQAFAYSPAWLGSDLPYLKYFAQYFHYFPLRPPQRKPFTNEILRPRLVFATGVRFGLAQGIGGDVPTSERFYAGGSTTLRGFEQNAVGPIGVNNVPAGGNMLLVLNNELRAPLAWIVDGVVFVDIGNVFARVTDFALTDLRKSAGVGLRVRTPWFLIRGDYGVVVDRQPGERRGRFYFSIGQAF